MLIVVVIAVGALLFFQRRRSAALQQKFGPEYQRAVGQFGDERKAEAELAAREKRVRSLNIRALTPEDYGDPEKWDPLRGLKPMTFYVQPGHYLCLGDNSAQSSDSRKWGAVPERLMLGKAVFVFWPAYPPPSRIGFIK